MPEDKGGGVAADLEIAAIDAIAAGKDCPDCGATWGYPEPEEGRRNANMVMVHATSCILYHEPYADKNPDA